MTEIKAKKSKPKYSTLRNSIYLIKNIWKWDKILFLFGFMQIPASVIVPFLTIYLPKLVIDSVTSKVSVGQLLFNIGMPIVGIIVLNTLLNVSFSITGFRGISYRANYTELITMKALDTDFENIDGPVGQEKITKAQMATASNNSAAETIIKVSVTLISNIMGLLLYGGIIATIHPIIVVFLVMSSVINYFLGVYISKFEHRNKDNLVPIERKLRYVINKTGEFNSAKDMRLYSMFKWFKQMFIKLKKEKIYYQKKNIYRRYISNFIDGVLVLFRDGITYGFLIYSVLYKDMTIGNFVLYFGAVTGFSTWLSGIVANFNSLNTISLDVCDLREYLEMEDKMNRAAGVDLPSSVELPCDIELRNLYYKYPGAEHYTIKNMNVHIRKGEKIALVGINGAGKTTLVKLICGLYTPTKGEIYINGKKSNLYNRDEYYTLFSVVFQDTHLLPVSIEKNIALQPESKIDCVKLEKVLNMSGLIEKLDTLPKGKETLLVKSIYEEAIDLSGGEMQKLMLARALYKNAPIIILDEPTAALDPIAESEIYEKYNELTREHTSIFISHRLSSTRFCDRILFIENGTLLEEGSHDDLMKKQSRYKDMYDMQSYYYKDDIGGEKYA